ncbi:GAF domain-containing sensor histidine kinase [Paeniglutamicibacter psychrophenolicus]|uniref:GAF domain-containing sensor histidine kinase n=1 Tax=Paeniglutamicibacter psychrophenolicus TaxID=257454 RepID=UPI00277DD273|nr:GAF domain-containing sensor histidine kinase [Paeniglutamicibacter psychrophenolicus]MDQ0092493.1 signal transduction histidine kinase [Paeniglutamicibacter psychrophenolicus]
MIASTEELVQFQARMQGLLASVIAISQDLRLDSVLRHVVKSACKLTDARYGALGVLGENGMLSRFITEGIEPETAERIGPVPRGEQGALGMLMSAPRPIRLQDLHTHPASVGFPRSHPPTRSFLNVPLRIHDVVFGNLYLTDKRNGTPFTADDENLAVVLAAAAGFAIENARLFDEAHLRTRWMEASMQVAVQMLDRNECNAESGEAIVANQALEASSSALAMVAIRDGKQGTLRVSTGSGLLTPDFLHRSLHLGESPILSAQESNHPIALDLAPHLSRAGKESGIGPALLITLGSGAAGDAFLILARPPGAPAYSDLENALAGKYGRQSALALELMRVSGNREESAVFADRDRIAKDLHDLVIQRLFAAGFSAKSLARFTTEPVALERIDSITDELDSTMADLRETIHALQEPQDTAMPLSTRISQVVRKLSSSLPFAPDLHVAESLDRLVPLAMEGHVLAVVSEGLSNAINHAKAASISVRVDVDTEKIVVSVIDDGGGFRRVKGRNGLDNMKARAQNLNGNFLVRSAPNRGTTFEWTAPLPGDIGKTARP